MTIIGMKELRTHTKEITRRVQAGESFTVVSRSKPLFNIVPTDGQPNGLDSWLDTYIQTNRRLLESLAQK